MGIAAQAILSALKQNLDRCEHKEYREGVTAIARWLKTVDFC
jgi:hypothetical protein